MNDLLKKNRELIRWLAVGTLASAFVFINWPFFMPLLLAGVFAFGLVDFVGKLSFKLKTSYTTTVWISMVAGLILFWLPLAIATYRVLVHIGDQSSLESNQWTVKIVNLKAYVIDKIAELSALIGVDIASPARALLEKLMSKVGEIVLQLSTGFFQQLPALFLASLVFTLALLLFLLKAPQIKVFFNQMPLFEGQKMQALIEVIKQSCRTTLFSTVVIGVIQAFIIGLGCLAFDQGDFWLVVPITFFVSFIPVIGAAPLGYLLAVLAFLDGKVGSAVGLAVFATIAGTIDNILKPFMIGGDTRVPPIIAFTSVLGAVIMLGIPGLILGPVLMNLAVSAIPILSGAGEANEKNQS